MTVTIDRKDDIATVTVDNPPVNALGQALRQGLWDAVGTIDADPSIRAVILLCAGRTFIAGADVTEFGKPPVPPHLPDLVNRIEAAAKPWIAAIHGSALGGGFEVAMGCRFRVALDTASVGLPEVNLGIIPGASGTVRTPRLAGVEAAVDLVTTGRPVRAAKARDLGLIDAVVTGDLRTEALAFARAALAAPLPPPVSARPVTSPDPAWWDAQRSAISKRAKGETAPLRALDCLRFAAEHPFAEAMAQERATFLDLRGSDQAAALRHVFFAERAAPRPAHLADVPPHPIRSTAVIGSGAVAIGIAAALRDAGLTVTLIEADDKAVTHALANLRGIFATAVKRGKLTEAQAAERMAGVTATGDYSALAETDFAIETLAQDPSATGTLFARLGQSCRPDAILATLDPSGIATDLPNPARLIGLNFSGPAHLAKLVEIIPAPDTAPDTCATAFALARALGKIPVQTGTATGAIGSRLLNRTRTEAETLVRQGTPLPAIDAALRAYGFEPGPLEAQDPNGPHIPAPQTTGTPALSAEDIAARLTAAMANEGRALLAEGIALKPADIDLVAIHALGYPRWRGGPMFEAARKA